MPDGPRHTLATIRAALDHVSPTATAKRGCACSRRSRASSATTGASSAQEWSAPGSTYKAADFRATWKSLRPEGGVTIGTLLALAKAGGFALPGANASKRPRTAPAADRTAEHAARDARGRAAGKAARRGGGRGAAALRRCELKRDTRPTSSARASRRMASVFEPDGTLLVPMFNAAGALCNLQTIAPDGTKKFLAGGQAVDLFFIVLRLARVGRRGDRRGLRDSGDDPRGHGATGRGSVQRREPSARRAHGAQALGRMKLLVICADDDRETEARSGRNPGRQAARDAAKVRNAVVAIPAPLEAGETDFNDLARRAGLEAVAAIVQAAIERNAAPATPARWRIPQTKGHSEYRCIPKSRADDGAGDDLSTLPTAAFITWHAIATGRTSRQWVCAPLTVEARTRDGDGASWGYLLGIRRSRGHAEATSGPGSPIRR